MENNDTIFSEIHPEETEVGLLQGLLTRLIDIGIELLVLFLVYRFMPADMLRSLINGASYITFFIIVIIVFLYQFLFLLFFNKTVGMMICRAKYLNKKMQPLSAREKLFSVFRTRFSGIKFYKEK